jgi:uncharacterized membrane protein YqjE
MVRAGSDAGRARTHGGNGRPSFGDGDNQSIGGLFKQLSTDSSHLLRQEIALAKTELRETGSQLGQTASKLGIAIGVGISGTLALTAFVVIGLGDLIGSYWASALIVGVVMVGTAAILARRAIASLKAERIGVPETAGTLRDDTRWAKEEVHAFKRAFTA